MTRTIIYNQEMLEVVKEDLQFLLEQYGKLNIFYEQASKPRTKKQEGFVFAALINQITDYFRSSGFNIDEEDVRYALYDQVSQIVPEMVVDKMLFGGKPRIKHISEMDRTLMSKFIDGIFTILDTNPMYAGIKLHPSVYYNWIFHLDPEEVKWAKQHYMPERDAEYLDYVRTLPCICCGIQHRSEAHHIRDNRTAGIAIKSPDWYSIPLCHNCHLGIAHGTGFKKAMEWVPLDLIDFCKLCYIRWKNKQ